MTTADQQPLIRIRQLWTQFDSFVVHQNLDLDVMPGEIMSLVGGSGSGKTTLLRQILGLERPTRGTVKVFGENIHSGDGESQRRLRTRWGMLFQQGALFSALTTLDNVAQPMRELRNLPEDLIRDAALFKLSLVGITPRDAMKMPADLSGGMIKRVALARALALEPELLFLDEPTAGLDPQRSDEFVELIRTLHQQMRLTVVMVTHDLDTLYALSTRIAVLAEKHVIACAPPREILSVHHPFIEEFFLGERGKRALTELDTPKQV
ncbi:MAG: ATP-binding cassette domain-containing protein [Proteobacteria bacterium]|nr:ATP-binding cassette domain-containing protein [Pseudomonadota bacterium]